MLTTQVGIPRCQATTHRFLAASRPNQDTESGAPAFIWRRRRSRCGSGRGMDRDDILGRAAPAPDEVLRYGDGAEQVA